MASEWGRKETIIWPPRQPGWSYLAVAFSLLSTLVFGWQHFRFQQSTLQRTYTVDYLRAEVGAVFSQHGSYRLVYVNGAGLKHPRLALAADFAEDAASPSLSSSALAQGFQKFYRGPELHYSDASLARWYQGAIFEGKGLFQMYMVSLAEGLAVLLLALYYAVPLDLKRFRAMKYGRRLRGPVLLAPKEFNKTYKGDGIGFLTDEMKPMMRIPRRLEPQHFQIMGDTGVGKTQLIMQMLRQIRDRDDSAIVYDPAGEFVQRFFDAKRGDIILNPLDARCPYWGPASELRSNAEADAIAESLYQPTTDAKDEFFHQTPAQIFAHLLKMGPTPHELAAWMANAKEIEARVAGTEMAHYIGEKAGPQRAGVLSSLGLVAKSLRVLPTHEQTGDRVWSATDWAEHRKGWIFITSRPAERITLRPLHSLWIDLLIMRLMSEPKPDQKRVWFVIEELASLQRLPKLHIAVTEARKSHNPIVLCFQGKSQLEVIYGHLAEVMLSQPATRVFMRTAEPKAAEWISNSIGKVEIERLKETKFDGSRSGKNFTVDRQVEQLVMDSEIGGLSERHAYLKVGNNVARFSFDYIDMPKLTPAFIARRSEMDKLSFDPYTMKPVTPPKEAPEAVAETTIPTEQELAEAIVLAQERSRARKRPQPSLNAPTEAKPKTEPNTSTGESRPHVVLPSTRLPKKRTNADPEEQAEPEEAPTTVRSKEQIVPEESIVQGETEHEDDHQAQVDAAVVTEGYTDYAHHF